MKKPNKPDQSVHLSQKKKIDFNLNIRELPWTEKQKQFIELALDKKSKILVIDGVWGSGKTILGVYCFLRLLNEKKVSDIIYIRNPVESSTTGKLGFIPGEASEKMAPYGAPLIEKLAELLSPSDAKRIQLEGRVEILPVGFIRGLNWVGKVILIDEAASLTWEDLLLIVSRCGEHCKVFIVGDAAMQNDIGSKSGFLKFFDTFDDQESKDNGIYTCKFKEQNDIMRSELLRFIMKKINKVQ